MTGEEKAKVYKVAQAMTHKELVKNVADLVELVVTGLNIMETHGDFRNGNVHNGVDEGEALTTIYIGSIQGMLDEMWELT